MSAETIELIIKWGPLALVGIVFLWCFLLGVIRGSYKVLRRIIYVVLYTVLIWVFMDKITNFVLDLKLDFIGFEGVRPMVVELVEKNETVNKFLSYSPYLKGLIIESPEIIVKPILFIVLMVVGLPLSLPIYWIFILIYNFIAKQVFKRRKYEVDESGKILRNEKGKKIKVIRKKHRLLGGLLRGAQGVVLICIVLLPVNFVNRIYNKVKGKAELEKGETLCDVNSSLKDYKDICGYIDLYNQTIFAKLGGDKSVDKFISDELTKIEYKGNEIKIENELSNVAISAVLLNDSGVLELFKDGKFDLDTLDLSVVNFDKLDQLVDHLFKSSLVSEISETGVRYVLNEVVNDKLVDLLKDDNIVSKLEYENSDEIKQELKDVIGVLKLAVEKGLVDTVVGNRQDVVAIVNNVNEEDVETLLNKILSLRILNKAMPSAIEAYGKEYGINVPDNMSDELNREVASLLADAIGFVKTLEITKLEDITKGNIVDNLSNALFENGTLKTNTKSDLATLLNDLNQSYLFRDVLHTQINKFLDEKDYNVDARVLKYVSSETDWLNELDVLEKAFSLYERYEDTKTVNYDDVTEVLNELSGTKVLISLLPFAYEELLPKIGIEIDGGKLPSIDFGSENEEATKLEFYSLWEDEVATLKNIAEAAESLQIQSLEDVNLDMIKDSTKVDSLSTILGEVYNSTLLKDPFVDFMKDTINEFVTDFDVEFTKEELLAINTKEKWNNELTNINNALDVDLSSEENINSTNLNKIFTAIGNMELFKTKKVDILKYAIKESNFLTEEEFNSISWPNNSNQGEVDSFWNNETGVLVNIVDEKDVVTTLANVNINTMSENDINKIGNIINEVMKSSILRPIVVDKVSELMVENDVKDDRDAVGITTNLKNTIVGIADWKVELALIKEMVVISDSITSDNMDDVESGQAKNKVEKLFDNIESSSLLNNSKAGLLLKAVEAINITQIPSGVTVDTLRANDYALYDNEVNVIIEVSKNKSDFDILSSMSLDAVDTVKVGGLLDTVSKSAIFGDYVVDQVKTVFINNGIKDDRDVGESTTNLENSIASVDDWSKELSVIKGMLNIEGATFNAVALNGKTNIENMLDSIEESKLLQNTRANLLIKAVSLLELTDISVPASVTVETLKADSYKQYENEKKVFITFAENKNAVENLSDITAIEGENKKALGSVLDAMKVSKILETKYTKTINTALSSIKNNEHLISYGVVFNANYSSIVWSNTYAEDGITVVEKGEIDNLLFIKDNISKVAGYTSSDLASKKSEIISVVGSTLDAVSNCTLLGDDQANKIANTVISTLTVGMIPSVSKTGATWTATIENILNSY